MFYLSHLGKKERTVYVEWFSAVGDTLLQFIFSECLIEFEKSVLYPLANGVIL